jgi:flagellin
MALRINTNVASLNAHKNMIKTDNSLSSSLEKLSSGLRINKAADDASGMAIADSLRSQARGLGQAIRNGNDGISIVQTADAALEESINIVNTIKQKSIQSAQDGQTADSRKAIQADITKLRDELDTIAKTTSFNGQKLLSGNFADKKFQIGAYAGETVDISIQSAEAGKIGHISTSDLTFASEGTAELAIYSNQRNETFNLNSVEIAYDNTRENSVGAVADAINVLSDQLGITASASVTSTTTSNIAAGTTDDNFAINGVKIGAIAVSENDSTGDLVSEINQKTDQHGVVASVDQGFLTLTSTDDRAIEVTQDAGTTAVLGNTADMSTLGMISLTQQGTADITVDNRLGGTAVALLDDVLLTTGATSTTISSTLASGSIVKEGSTIGAGSVLESDQLEVMSGDVFTTGSSVLGSGSILASGSVIAGGSTLAGAFTTRGTTTDAVGTLGAGSTIEEGSTIGAGTVLSTTSTVKTSGNTGSTESVSTVLAGSTLASGTTLAVGTVILAADIDASGFIADGGELSLNADGIHYTVSTAAELISGTTALNGNVTLTADSNLVSGSLLAAGSVVGADINNADDEVANTNMTLTTGTDLTSGSILQKDTNIAVAVTTDGNHTLSSGSMTTNASTVLQSGSSLADSTTLSDAWHNATDINVNGGSMTLAADSTLVTGFSLADGSSIGGTITLANNETVDSSTDMRLAAGSTLADGSTIKAGTFLTNDVLATDGNTYLAGSAIEDDIVTDGDLDITNAMTLNGGSIMQSGTVLTANTAAADNAALGSTSAGESYRLSDIDVTTQEGAQIGISVADAALKGLDKIRSDLGSVQNQLTSTIANISTTKVNVQAAESTIRDVDFAEESANFTKMQILSQAGTFAMSQANSSAQGVLSLLQ